MVLEVARGSKRLGAFCVRTDEWAFPSVHPSVDIQVLWGIEALPTAGELALARSVGDVDLLDVGAQVCRE